MQPAFLEEAAAWIDANADRTGELEQPHVRWWSTVIRVPTAEGDLWFKASRGSHVFEAGLLAILEEVAPGHTPELVAHDAARGWLLMQDGGERLREIADLGHWERLLPRYAELQIALEPHAARLLAAGVPDERLEVLPGLFAALLDDRAACVEPEDGLTDEEYHAVRALAPALADSCRRLGAFGIPDTIQHDDLHDGNVFVRGGRYLFFDWGDSCVSHPFHSLVVTMRHLSHRWGLPPGGPDILRLRDVYLEPYGPPAQLAGAVELAHFTGTVARALAWHRFVSSSGGDIRHPDGDAVPYGLRRALDPGPLGSWS